MKSLFVCRSLIRVAVIVVVMAFMASQGADTYAKSVKLDQHDADIKADIATHDTDIKAAITQHDTDVYNDMVGHGSNMTTEHGNLETKLDQILEGGGGECPDCPDAWDKLLTTDRFTGVLGVRTVNPLTFNGILDKETCLVWEQSPDATTRTWGAALLHCFASEVGGIGGWRLPTIEELASLKDTVNINPALPSGHPFSNEQSSFYWSSTTSASDASFAWSVGFGIGDVGIGVKASSIRLVWCVRGGQGHDAY